MDPTPLVIDEIDAGAEFVKRFSRYQPVRAAYWLKASEEAVRYLHVAFDGLTDDTFDVAYGEVLRITNEMTDHYIDPFRVKLVGADDPVVRAVLDIYRRYPGRIPTRFNGSALGGVAVDAVYIYPQPAATP